MKNHKNYASIRSAIDGFAVLPVVLAVATVGIISGVGYVVYTQSQQDDSANQFNANGTYQRYDDGDFDDRWLGNNTPVEGEIDAANGLELIDQLNEQELTQLNSITLERFGSDSRYTTAVEVSKTRFPNGARDVVVINGQSYADAISAIGITYSRPLLYLPPNAINVNDSVREVTNEIKRLGANRIILVGGTSAISAADKGTLQDMTGIGNIVRLSGPSRVESAIAVAESVYTPSSDTVFIANGYEEADSALFQRSYEEGPIVFANQDGSMHPASLEFIRSKGFDNIVLLGSLNSVSAQVQSDLENEFGENSVVRIAGSNRFHTATAVSQYRYPSGADTVYVVNEIAEADAVMASALAAGREGPVLYVKTNSIPLQTAHEIERLNPSKIVVVGGTARVSDSTAQQLQAFASGLLSEDEVGHFVR